MQISCLGHSRLFTGFLLFLLLECLRLSRFTLESPAKVNPPHPRSPTDAHRTWKIDSLLVGLIRCLITLSPTGKSSMTGILFQPASPQAELAVKLRTQKTKWSATCNSVQMCVCVGGVIQRRWQVVFKCLFSSCPYVQNRAKNKRPAGFFFFFFCSSLPTARLLALFLGFGYA